jgi:hypothetical protein
LAARKAEASPEINATAQTGPSKGIQDDSLQLERAEERKEESGKKKKLLRLSLRECAVLLATGKRGRSKDRTRDGLADRRLSYQAT